MNERSQIFLWDRLKGENGELVEATLIDSLDVSEVEGAVAAWRPLIEIRARQWLAEGKPRSDWPQHHHWDWKRKTQRYYGLLAYQFLGIECEGEMQGMMLVATEGNLVVSLIRSESRWSM